MTQNVAEIIFFQHIWILVIKGQQSILCGRFFLGISLVQCIHIFVRQNALDHAVRILRHMLPTVIQIVDRLIDSFVGQRVTGPNVLTQNTHDIGNIMLILTECSQLHCYQIFPGNCPNVDHIGECPVMSGICDQSGRVGCRVSEIIIQPAVGQAHGVSNIVDGILHKEGILTQQGFTWHKSAITRVLKNYTYTGNLLLQTKFRENHLTKRTLVNHGQLPQYHATDTHEPIIDIGTYNSVQLEMHRRAQKYGKRQTSGKYPFSGMITCALCGKHYRRKVTATGPVWICSTYNTHGKAACPSKAIPESTLMEVAATVSATGEITAVTAHNDNTLEFTLADRTVTVKQWQDRSRAASWTPEMRAAAGAKTRERKVKYA